MKTGQVQLQKLIFSENWEDPLSDERALDIKQGDTVLAITSGACNALGFLRFHPKEVYCLDINPAQNYLLEFKKALFRKLEYEDVGKMIGVRPCLFRERLYQELEPDLSAPATVFWRRHQSIVRNGLLMNGRYERYVKWGRHLIQMIQGKKRIEHLFSCPTIGQQRRFYEEKWDNAAWRILFRLLFNKRILSKRGLKSDYFAFDEQGKSYSESFYIRTGNAIREIPLRSNYFMALYLLGRYLNTEALPEYLKERNFEIIRGSLDKLVPVTEDCKEFLSRQPRDTFDAMSISNICELMDESSTAKLFAEVARTGKDGCRLILRNLMVPREVPPVLRSIIVKDQQLSNELQNADRSFVYSKVAAYTIRKGPKNG